MLEVIELGPRARWEYEDDQAMSIESGMPIEFRSSLSIRRLAEHPNIVGRVEAKVYESRGEAREL